MPLTNMHISTFFLLIGLLCLVAAQSYALEDDYGSASFFDMFDFFTAADPTNGYVSYVDEITAQNDGLISNNNGSIYIGVDSTNLASGSGRSSVRVSSKKTYNHGLFVLDLAHMPGGICGTWPAFWMVGPDWPNNGEIDIIEGVNSATANTMTLHTDAGCSVSNSTPSYSGILVTPNCDVNAPGQATNAGCSIDATSSQTFGSGFNAIGGGVYATEWTSAAISIYFFPRGAIPTDISSGNPDPSGWGQPQATFSGGCNIDSHVVDQQIVFDTTFCGDWAGNVWSTDEVCSPLASTCEAYVQNNPSAFVNAYWSINSLRVYTASGSSPTTSTVSVSTTAVSSTSPTSYTSSLSFTTSTTSTTSSSFTTSTISPSFTTSTISSSFTTSTISPSFTTSTSSITSISFTTSLSSSTSTPSSITPTLSTTSLSNTASTPYTTSLSSPTPSYYPTTLSFTISLSSPYLSTASSPSMEPAPSSSWSADSSQQTPWPTTWGTPWPAPTNSAPDYGHYTAYDDTWNEDLQGGRSWRSRRTRRDLEG